jgi:hypothetical protein
MNETEKQQIIDLVAAGKLNAEQAAGIIIALTPQDPTTASSAAATPPAAILPASAEAPRAAQPVKEQMIEVQMQRADGSVYTIQVPNNLVQVFWTVAKTTIKQSVKTAAQESWDGFKHVVKRKAQETAQSVKDKAFPPPPPPTPVASLPPPAKADHAEAKLIVLQMLQEGSISAQDAADLLAQL